jgi:glycosyltransferase involved in cell wall biosynthesis
MKKALWLASWYPNKLSPFDGDFLQRHAKAVALYDKVHVIYIVKDEGKIITHYIKTEKTTNGNLTEEIIYYSSFKTGIKIFDKYFSQRKYSQLYQKAIYAYITSDGKPDLVHVQIAMKAGLAALWMKRKWGIPYIVSEQATIYLENADLQVNDYSLVFQRWQKKVLEQASMVTVVSHFLGKAIQRHFPVVKYEVIPNVVDTGIFYPAQKESPGITRFIHISNMNYQKNTEAILEALHLLKVKFSFEMYLYGTMNNVLQNLINRLQLQDHVFVMGEVSQPELAKAIQQSDALVLYSRFETFGCVLIEANACGIPVVVSDIEVFHELIEESRNGIFAEENKPLALAGKLETFILQKNSFNKNDIAEATASTYNFKKIGGLFTDLYTKISR